MTKPDIKVNTSAHFWSFLYLSLVHILQYYVHQLQSFWPSQFSNCLFNSERPLGSVWNPLPYNVDWKVPQARSWDNQNAHLICFPSLRDHHLMQLISKFEDCHLIYFVSFWGEDGKVNQVSYSIMAGGRNNIQVTLNAFFKYNYIFTELFFLYITHNSKHKGL